jgi:hypothetical protein
MVCTHPNFARFMQNGPTSTTGTAFAFGIQTTRWNKDKKLNCIPFM